MKQPLKVSCIYLLTIVTIMKYIFKFLIIITLLACSDTSNEQAHLQACTNNPLETIEWIRDLINNTDSNGLEIIQYEYKQQTVFSINRCLNCADNLITVYDCKKNKICEFGGIAGLNTCSDFDTKATNQTVIFTQGFCEKNTIIDALLYKNLASSPINTLKIEGNCLEITFNILSTQNRIEDVTLVDSGNILESDPVQRRLKFNVKESITKPTTVIVTTSFDISILAEEGETIILNIDGYKDALKYTRIP